MTHPLAAFSDDPDEIETAPLLSEAVQSADERLSFPVELVLSPVVMETSPPLPDVLPPPRSVKLPPSPPEDPADTSTEF
jgi:hypothetical protein